MTQLITQERGLIVGLQQVTTGGNSSLLVSLVPSEVDVVIGKLEFQLENGEKFVFRDRGKNLNY